MSTPGRLAVFAAVEFSALGAMLFGSAGTVHFPRAWVFLAVFALSSWIPTLYLLKTNPVALERRMSGGPTAETRSAQKAVMAGLYAALASMIVVSGLDHRFGWSSVPTWLVALGNVMVAAGLLIVGLVIVQNNYAATTVRVEAGQTLASTGLYTLVRHPMYTGNVIMMLGIPLALGSYWGLLLAIPGAGVLVARIRDEEKLLTAELAGYREYTQRVRYRLLPGAW